MTSKACTRCKQTKSLDDFYSDKRVPDGKKSECKECHKSICSSIRKKNHRSYLTKRRATKQKNRDKYLAKDRIWREKNKTILQAAARRRYHTNPEVHIAKVLRWAKNNPEKRRNNESRRRAKIKRNGEFLILPSELRQLYSSPCSNCGTTKQIEADHVIPVSRGGRHSIGNLQPMCRSCNSSKRDKFMVEWRMRRSA
jgi:5-methylcytosine-specific restriction endonuclease McrA